MRGIPAHGNAIAMEWKLLRLIAKADGAFSEDSFPVMAVIQMASVLRDKADRLSVPSR
jgi:hypothetical protein